MEILRSKPVLDTIPGFIANIKLPMVNYSYSKTIDPRIFNFDNENSDIICNCGDSAFIDIDIDRVLTGNLSIIRDRKLRKLMQTGPSYREQSSINWDINLKNYITAVRQYKKWAKQEKVDTRVLNEWEGTVIDMVGKRIDNKIIRRKHKRHYRSYRKYLLREKVHQDYLKEFQEHFVLVPADKAKTMSLLYVNSIT